MDCIYCKKTYATSSSLLKHQRTSKLCLSMQEQLGIPVIKKLFTCMFCKKELTSNVRLSYHQKICKHQNKETLEEKMDHIAIQLKLKDEKIQQLENEMNELKIKPVIQHVQHFTQNNQISIHTYMTPERVKEAFDMFTLDTLLGSQKALANFTVDQFLMGKDKPAYLCTDRSRKKFFFMDETGQLIEDPNCEKLVGLITPGLTKVQELYEVALFDKPKKGITEERLQDSYESILALKEDGSQYQCQLSKRLPSNIKEKERMEEQAQFPTIKITTYDESESQPIVVEPEPTEQIGGYSLDKLDIYRKKYKLDQSILGPKNLLDTSNQELYQSYIDFLKS